MQRRDGGDTEPGLGNRDDFAGNAWNRFEALVAETSDVIAVVTAAGTVSYASAAAVHVLGRRHDELVGRDVIDVIFPDDRERMARLLERHLRGEMPSLLPTERATFRLAHPDGELRWVEVMVRNLVDDPAIAGLVVSLRDITEPKRADFLLAAQTRVLELIARGAPLGETLDVLARLAEDQTKDAVVAVMLVDSTGSALVQVAGPSLPAGALAALGAGVPIGPGSGACGSAAFDRRLTIVEDIAADPICVDWRDLAAESGLLACWSTPIVSASTGDVLGTFATYYRTTRRPTEGEIGTLLGFGELAGIAIERKQAEDTLAHRALHDPLTGLPNRALFYDRLAHAVGQMGRQHGMVAVLFCDLDGFKMINDWLGHEAGDRALVAAADRLRNSLRAGDSAARFGGDEFVVLCENVENEHDLVVLAERVAETLAAPLSLGTEEVSLTCSIGISVARTADIDPESLLRDADTAMYQAKARGKARFELFDDDMRNNVRSRLEVEVALRMAVDRGELCVHYQPEVRLRDGSVTGVEALVRWQHPVRGLVGPEEFIGVASETWLIVAIGTYVIREACRQAKVWRDRLPSGAPIVVWINLSRRQLVHPDLVGTVATALADSGVDPATVRLEVSESALMEDAETSLTVLEDLSRLGVGLGIDDFGIGFSSLTFLRRFPVDRLKIQRSFVAEPEPDGKRGSVAAAIVGLAHLLGLEVVAGGLETEAELQRMRVIGCDLGQGWLFAPAVPPDEVIDVIKREPFC